MSWNRSPAASARVRVACGALLILALGTVLSFTAFYKVCTGFRFWDDMGYVMLTQKTLATGHPLYDQTYTQYGPAYYAWKQVLLGVTRLSLSHDSTALFTAASWVTAALLCAGYVARMTRSGFLTALAGFGVFYILEVLVYEPGHPQEFCAVLLGMMLFLSSFLTSGRYTTAVLAGMGFLVGLLAMTKANLAVYAAVAGWMSLASLIAAPVLRAVLFGSGALAAAVLPVLLMRNNLASAGDYCLLESGAVLLVVGGLAISKPKSGLSCRTLAAPLLGCLAGVVVCAAYALARGTSVRGLIHGVVLQHVGFDQVYFRWPGFGTGNVMLSLGVGLLIWAASGPALRYWRRMPWVPTALEFSVTPMLLLIALLADPWSGPKLDWVKPVFIWALPLVAATGHFFGHTTATAWDMAPRQFARSLAVLIALWGYPVWASQAELSLFLLLPVAIAGSADAWRFGEWFLLRGSATEDGTLLHSAAKEGGAGHWKLPIVNLQLSIGNSAGAPGHHRRARLQCGARLCPQDQPQRGAAAAGPADTAALRTEGAPGGGVQMRPNSALMLSCIAGASIVCVGLLQASSASAAYHRLEPSGLPGSSLLRLPRAQSDFYRRILESARAHGRSFFTMPGLGSLYFWAEQAPPTCCIPGDWMTLLTEETQLRVVEDLRRTPDLCVIRWNGVVDFWTNGRNISGNQIVRYIEDNYTTVESLGDCDIMVRRATQGKR